MICHKHRCIFVHVPKTGGQSIEQFFLERNNLSINDKHKLLISRNDDPSKGPTRLAHLRAHEYIDCGHVCENLYGEYFTFAIVRNPWARLVSEYLHKKLDNRYSFRDFVFYGMPAQNDFCDKYRHVIPQTDYICNRDGQEIVDFVGRFENLHQDFDYICSQLTISDASLPHVNSTSSFRRSLERKIRHLFIRENRIKKHYSEYYDRQTIDRVGQLYAEDINRFNYDFV